MAFVLRSWDPKNKRFEYFVEPRGPCFTWGVHPWNAKTWPTEAAGRLYIEGLAPGWLEKSSNVTFLEVP